MLCVVAIERASLHFLSVVGAALARGTSVLEGSGAAAASPVSLETAAELMACLLTACAVRSTLAFSRELLLVRADKAAAAPSSRWGWGSEQLRSLLLVCHACYMFFARLRGWESGASNAMTDSVS